MAFALQKRCSTAELSRRWLHRKHPEGQFQPVVASGFEQGPTDMTFDGAVADHQPLCNGPVAQAFEQQGRHPPFGGGQRSVGWHGRVATVERIPRRCDGFIAGCVESADWQPVR